LTQRRHLAAAVIAATMLSSAAQAGDTSFPTGDAAGGAQPPIAEAASDLAYKLCPRFLAGQVKLAAPELGERGFGPQVETADHPRFGPISIVTAHYPDGRLAFGGASGTVCMVVADGPQRDAILAGLRANMALTGLAFEPTDSPGMPVRNSKIATFKAPVDGKFLYLQLLEIDNANPTVSALLYNGQP